MGVWRLTSFQLLPEKTEGCGAVSGSPLSQDGMLGRDGALVSGP